MRHEVLNSCCHTLAQRWISAFDECKSRGLYLFGATKQAAVKAGSLGAQILKDNERLKSNIDELTDKVLELEHMLEDGCVKHLRSILHYLLGFCIIALLHMPW